MFCESCGSLIPDGQSFCTNCGSPAPQPVQPAPAAQESAPQPAFQPAPQPAPQPEYQPAPQPEYQPAPQPAYQQPVYQQPVYVQPVVASTPAQPAKRKNGMATVGMIFGILTVCFCWIPAVNIFLTPILGLLGLVFSIVGLVKKNVGGKGKAIAGLVLSLLGAIVTVAMYVYMASYISNSPEGAEIAEAWDELMEEINSDSYYSTSYSEGSDPEPVFIDGDFDFATTDKGYVSGVLFIDGFRVDY